MTKKTPNPHENYSPDWLTPPPWWDWVESTLDGINLDPCSDRKYPGQASHRYHGGRRGADGLKQTWNGTVYCNPPGSNSVRSVKPWWAHAMAELDAGRTTDLVWCFFNCETVFVLDPCPLELPGWIIMPSRRISFYRDGALPIDPKTGRKTAPRNRTWFYTTRRPATPPIMSWIIETGDPNFLENLGLEAAN